MHLFDINLTVQVHSDHYVVSLNGCPSKGLTKEEMIQCVRDAVDVREPIKS